MFYSKEKYLAKLLTFLLIYSIHPHPYNNVSPQSRRHHRQMKDRSQHVASNHHVQIEELPDDYDEGAPSNANVHQ